MMRSDSKPRQMRAFYIIVDCVKLRRHWRPDEWRIVAELREEWTLKERERRGGVEEGGVRSTVCVREGKQSVERTSPRRDGPRAWRLTLGPYHLLPWTRAGGGLGLGLGVGWGRD
jgi:hypothetical protein